MDPCQHVVNGGFRGCCAGLCLPVVSLDCVLLLGGRAGTAHVLRSTRAESVLLYFYKTVQLSCEIYCGHAHGAGESNCTGTDAGRYDALLDSGSLGLV